MIAPIKDIVTRHLEPRFYGALWCLGAVLVLAIVALAGLDATTHKSDITILAALLAVTMATIGWIWNGRQAIAMAKRTNALNMLARIGSADVNALKSDVYPYIEAYDLYKRGPKEGIRPEMPEEAIQKLLGVYEQMSVAIIFGAVDERIMHYSQALVTRRIYRGLYHHIENMQNNNKGYFSEFERLVCMWHPDLQRGPAKLEHPGHLFNPTRGADI